MGGGETGEKRGNNFIRKYTHLYHQCMRNRMRASVCVEMKSENERKGERETSVQRRGQW